MATEMVTATAMAMAMAMVTAMVTAMAMEMEMEMVTAKANRGKGVRNMIRKTATFALALAILSGTFGAVGGGAAYAEEAEAIVINEGFETTELGSPMTNSTVYGTGIAVSDAHAKDGSRSLRIKEETGDSWLPAMILSLNHMAGTSKVSMDMRIDESTSLEFEFDDRTVGQTAQHAMGLLIKNGAVFGGPVYGTPVKLTDLPSGEWFHLEIAIKVGPDYTRKYDVTVTMEGQEPIVGQFDSYALILPTFNYIGIYSNATEAGATAYIDNFRAVNVQVAEPAPVTKLSGEASVRINKPFTVTYGLEQVTTSIAEQEITFDFNPQQLEFVSAVSFREGIVLAEPVMDAPGKVRIGMTSTNAEQGIGNEPKIAALTFRAKSIAQSAFAKVSVSKADMTDIAGNAKSGERSSYNIEIIAEAPEDVNRDGKVSIADLGILTAHFGKNSSSADWHRVKLYDINEDGSIGIVDYRAVASAM